MLHKTEEIKNLTKIQFVSDERQLVEVSAHVKQRLCVYVDTRFFSRAADCDSHHNSGKLALLLLLALFFNVESSAAIS